MLNDDDTTVYDFPLGTYQKKDSDVNLAPVEARAEKARKVTNAWAAGAFDGRGWTRIKKVRGTRRHRYTLFVYLRCFETAQARELQATYEGTMLIAKNGRVIWTAAGPTALTFLRRIKPYVRWKKWMIRDAERFGRWAARTRHHVHLTPSQLREAETLMIYIRGRIEWDVAAKMAHDAVAADIKGFEHV